MRQVGNLQLGTGAETLLHLKACAWVGEVTGIGLGPGEGCGCWTRGAPEICFLRIAVLHAHRSPDFFVWEKHVTCNSLAKNCSPRSERRQQRRTFERDQIVGSLLDASSISANWLYLKRGYPAFKDCNCW